MLILISINLFESKGKNQLLFFWWSSLVGSRIPTVRNFLENFTEIQKHNYRVETESFDFVLAQNNPIETKMRSWFEWK